MDSGRSQLETVTDRKQKTEINSGEARQADTHTTDKQTEINIYREKNL